MIARTLAIQGQSSRTKSKQKQGFSILLGFVVYYGEDPEEFTWERTQPDVMSVFRSVSTPSWLNLCMEALKYYLRTEDETKRPKRGDFLLCQLFRSFYSRILMKEWKPERDIPHWEGLWAELEKSAPKWSMVEKSFFQDCKLVLDALKDLSPEDESVPSTEEAGNAWDEEVSRDEEVGADKWGEPSSPSSVMTSSTGSEASFTSSSEGEYLLSSSENEMEGTDVRVLSPAKCTKMEGLFESFINLFWETFDDELRLKQHLEENEEELAKNTKSMMTLKNMASSLRKTVEEIEAMRKLNEEEESKKARETLEAMEELKVTKAMEELKKASDEEEDKSLLNVSVVCAEKPRATTLLLDKIDELREKYRSISEDTKRLQKKKQSLAQEIPQRWQGVYDTIDPVGNLRNLLKGVCLLRLLDGSVNVNQKKAAFALLPTPQNSSGVFKASLQGDIKKYIDVLERRKLRLEYRISLANDIFPRPSYDLGPGPSKKSKRLTKIKLFMNPEWKKVLANYREAKLNLSPEMQEIREEAVGQFERAEYVCPVTRNEYFFPAYNMAATDEVDSLEKAITLLNYLFG